MRFSGCTGQAPSLYIAPRPAEVPPLACPPCALTDLPLEPSQTCLQGKLAVGRCRPGRRRSAALGIREGGPWRALPSCKLLIVLSYCWGVQFRGVRGYSRPAVGGPAVPGPDAAAAPACTPAWSSAPSPGDAGLVPGSGFQGAAQSPRPVRGAVLRGLPLETPLEVG